MKFGFGIIYNKMSHICQFSENRFNDCYTSLMAEINFHSNYPYIYTYTHTHTYIDHVWVKFDTDLHTMLLNNCGYGNQYSEIHT